MKAMVLHEIAPIDSSPLNLEEVPDPQPGAGEVRIKVRCCAVCRTDLHVIEGDIPRQKMPVIPGHQVVGAVDRLGEGCRRWKVGDRIGIAWLRSTDGTCRFCLRGRENLCPNSRYTGYQADGGYAEYAVVPEDYAYSLPASFDDVAASPLLCAGIIGYRSLVRANLPAGGKLVMFGFGSSAHMLLPIVLRRGCEVYVVSRSANHRQLAETMGATWTGEDAAQLPAKMDSAIVFAPAGGLVLAALASLDRGGTMSLAGIHMSPIPQIDYDQFLFYERDVHPVTANTREDGRQFIAEAEAAGVRPHTRTYPLAEANQALQDLKNDRIDGTAVLVMGN